MKRFYSNVDKGKLLHIIYRLGDIVDFRENITPAEEFLQVASIKMDNGHIFKAHKHIEQVRTTNIAQESWIVIRGRVRVFLYDLDDNIIATPTLNQGDCSITFRGGHNYQSLDDDTIVYEFKTGPYQGIEKDKVLLEKKT